MGKKFVVRLTEQQLADIIAKQVLNKSGDFIRGLLKYPKDYETPDSEDTGTKQPVEMDEMFPILDLNNPEDFRTYQQIADKFISSRPSNLLNISGSMLATAAKNAQNNFGNYVPVELALAQLAQEGGFSNNPKARPIRTKNPFNVGNIDTGKNVYHNTVQSGIQKYYDLIARTYLGNGKTASNLLDNFVNKNGNRYASDRNYERAISKIVNQVLSIGQQSYASLRPRRNKKGYAK
jgi:hypothetical protein